MREFESHGITYYVAAVEPDHESPENYMMRLSINAKKYPEYVVSATSLQDEMKAWDQGGQDYVEDALKEESDRYQVIIADVDGESIVEDYEFVKTVVSGMEGRVWVLPRLSRINRFDDDSSEQE